MCVDSRVAGGTCSCSLIRVTHCTPWSSTVSFHRLLEFTHSLPSPYATTNQGQFTINNITGIHSIFINQVSSKRMPGKGKSKVISHGKKKRLRSAIVKPFYLTQWFSNGGNFASREHVPMSGDFIIRGMYAVMAGFPGGSEGKASICLQCEKPGFDPWGGKTPWRRAWQPTPVFSPGESPWNEEPGRLQSVGLQRVGHNWASKHSSAQHMQLLGARMPLNILQMHRRAPYHKQLSGPARE